MLIAQGMTGRGVYLGGRAVGVKTEQFKLEVEEEGLGIAGYCEDGRG